ncbi:hypothetical protein ABZS95_40815 [Streptomyces sp. NPDC005479]|uniref:hypothetical protein n=1 Tax=unclassified Streptomyces TaxID=2593676 RepID=UPI0033BF19A3
MAMPELWARTDAGRAEHHCVVIDSDGQRKLSRRVAAVNAFGDGEFVPLGPHLCQLFGQLFFEFVQFRAPRGDPFQQLEIQHAPDRRRPPGHSGQEPASRPSRQSVVARCPAASHS